MTPKPPSPGSPDAPRKMVQVTTTTPSRDLAVQIAEAAVTEGLAACAQVLGPLESTFRWQGAVDQATEWYCHCKTTADRLPDLEHRIRELHPSEVPEIIALPIVGGSAAYLAWIEQTVNPPGRPD